MENKDDILNNLLCMACLCVGRSIHEVRDEKSKKYYLDILNEIPLNDIKVVVPIICWECEAILHKVLAFREQVKDSYRILQTYTENLNECLLSDVSRSPRLKVHTNTPISIIADNLDDIKLEKNDNNKLDNQNNSNADISDGEPNEDIQTVICDVKRYKRKKKSIHKMRKISRQDDKDPVDITNEKGSLGDIKIEEKILENMLNETNDSQIDLRKKNEIILNQTNTDMKIELNNIIIEMDDVKSEFDDKEDNLDNSVYESDIKDIDSEIQSFLDNVKQNTDKNRSKSKKQCHTETKTKIITIDLSYEEMQAERTKMSEKDSFLNAKYKCESCLIVFNTEVSMKTHRSKKHEVKGDFICSICKTIISSVEAFTTHYKRHMRRYECPVCGKRTPDLKTIQQHIYTKHNNDKTLKKYQCNVCGKISNSLDTHRYHRDTHRARVECSQCDKTFSHRAGLMNHRLAVHESQNEFPCTVCNKVFRWKTSLKRHLEKHDNESKGTNSTNRAFCISCGIGFSSVCSYQRHLRNSLKHVTHDQLKFICDHCNQRFADKTKLRDHIEEKHLHRTFQCPICNKPSKNRVGLEQHIRAVHKGRPNNRMCHHCGKGFPTKVQLESHIRTHTGERPFMCEFCPTTFSQQSNLYKHHRQVHLNIKSKRYLCKKSRHDGNSTTDPQFTLPIMQYIPENGFSL